MPRPMRRLPARSCGDFAIAARVKRRLAGTRIGRLGEHPDGFDTCRVNYGGLKARLGVEIAQFELDSFFARAREAEPARVNAIAADLGERLQGFAEMDPERREWHAERLCRAGRIGA